MPNADALVGRYVLRQSTDAGGKQYLGYFREVCDEDKESGWVYDFATKKYVRAPASHCVALTKTRLGGRLSGLRIKVPGFGEGFIKEELHQGHALKVRVEIGEAIFQRSILVNFSPDWVVIPPRE